MKSVQNKDTTLERQVFDSFFKCCVLCKTRNVNQYVMEFWFDHAANL